MTSVASFAGSFDFSVGVPRLGYASPGANILPPANADWFTMHGCEIVSNAR